ncbi:MAG TPA: hypothetical protein VHC67_16705 [Gaiellaceae bacterium]|nr:hypothetical protein [Gaiellaceae bacterium]
MPVTRFCARPVRLLLPALAACLVTAGGAAATTGSAISLQTMRGAWVAQPGAIVAGPGGSLWFANGVGGSLAHVTRAGKATTFTSPTVSAPSALAVARDGALWFSNGYGSIDRLDPHGVVASYAVDASVPVGGLALATDGSVWFTTGGERVGRIAADGTVAYFNDPAAMRGTQGMAAGPDGTMWFTNYLGASIGRIAADGTVTTYTDRRIRYPAAIVQGPDHALWFTDDSGAVGRITTAGTVSVYGTPTTVGHPDAITIGPDRALWVTGRGGQVARVTTAGKITTYAVPQAEFAAGIASSNGSLWLTSYSGNSLVRLALKAKPSTTAKTTKVAPLARARPSKLPRVTVIADSVAGAVWFDTAARSTLSRGVDLFFEPGQGRQLGPPIVDPSGPEPAVDLIPHLGKKLGSTVVMFVGNNDVYSSAAQNVALADQELLAAGVAHIVWVTLHVSPDHTSYAFMNDAIAAAQAADPAHVSVVDWNAYAGPHPEWFQSDGVHLTGAGPLALARLLHSAIAKLAG